MSFRTFAGYINLGFNLRFLLLLIALMSLYSRALADEKPSRSVVYEEPFVWALAEKLSKELLQFQTMNGLTFSVGERGEMGMQYEILYHNYLVKCDGPLPELAGLIFVNNQTPPNDPEKIHGFYLSLLNKQALAILETWRAKTLLPILETLASGQYSFFPKCIVPGVLAQNEIPGVNAK